MPGVGSNASLPRFDSFNQQRYYFEIFNPGKIPFDFPVKTSAPWLVLSESQGKIEKDHQIWVSIDWSKLPRGLNKGSVEVTGANGDITFNVEALNPSEIIRESLHGFVESHSVVSIEPEHYTGITAAGENHWTRIKDYVRTFSGMRADAPVDAPGVIPGKNSPSL